MLGAWSVALDSEGARCSNESTDVAYDSTSNYRIDIKIRTLCRIRGYPKGFDFRHERPTGVSSCLRAPQGLQKT